MFLTPLSPPARFLVCFGLTAPGLLITLACILTLRDQARMDTASDWVRHTLQMENQVHELVLAVHRVDEAQHGYLYTGRNSYRESFEALEGAIPSKLAALRPEVSTDETQQLRLMAMEALVSDRLAVARQTIDLQKSGHHDDAIKVLRADRPKKGMENLDTISEEMRCHEKELLATRDPLLVNARKVHARWFYALLALNVGSLACTLFLLQRLSKAQALARICAWSKRIEHNGQWLSFEEYLSRRFSIDSTHTICPSEVDRLLSETPQEAPTEPVPAMHS